MTWCQVNKVTDNLIYQFPTVTVCSDATAKSYAPLEKLLNFAYIVCCDPENGTVDHCQNQKVPYAPRNNVVSRYMHGKSIKFKGYEPSQTNHKYRFV